MSRFVSALTFLLLLGNQTQAQEPATLKNLPGWVGAVAFSNEEHHLIIGTGDGSLTDWDHRRGKIMTVPKVHKDAVTAFAFPHGEFVVSTGHDHRIILLARVLIDLRGHKGAVLSASWSAKQKQLFTGSIDGTIHAWELGNDKPSAVLRDHTSWVNSLAIDRDETILASAGSDNAIHLRLLKDLKVFQTFRVKEGEVRSVAFSPDGKLLAAGIRYGWVRVWDLATKEVVFSTKAHAGETWAVAFTPDGKTLASAGGDWNQPGEVRRWEVGAWKEQATLKHSGEVLSLAISADGRWLAAGAWDRTVRIWELSPKPPKK